MLARGVPGRILLVKQREAQEHQGWKNPAVGKVVNRLFFSQSDGDETPFVNKEILPKIDGVLIVAEGGADASVRKNISEAVEALFGLDAHKIKIVKMKTKGDSN